MLFSFIFRLRHICVLSCTGVTSYPLRKLRKVTEPLTEMSEGENAFMCVGSSVTLGWSSTSLSSSLWSSRERWTGTTDPPTGRGWAPGCENRSSGSPKLTTEDPISGRRRRSVVLAGVRGFLFVPGFWVFLLESWVSLFKPVERKLRAPSSSMTLKPAFSRVEQTPRRSSKEME